jgi:hypothetical protein
MMKAQIVWRKELPVCCPESSSGFAGSLVAGNHPTYPQDICLLTAGCCCSSPERNAFRSSPGAVLEICSEARTIRIAADSGSEGRIYRADLTTFAARSHKPKAARPAAMLRTTFRGTASFDL